MHPCSMQACSDFHLLDNNEAHKTKGDFPILIGNLVRCNDCRDGWVLSDAEP